MKKILLTLVVLGCVSLTAFAQRSSTKSKFSIGLEGGVPVGDASKISSFAFGGSVKYEKPIITGLAFTLSAGYTYFSYKNDVKLNQVGFVDDVSSGEGSVPLKAGLKYYFTDAFYAEGQAGVSISTQSGGGTAFAYSPGIGLLLAERFDIGVRFEGWKNTNTSLNQVALRIAYGF